MARFRIPLRWGGRRISIKRLLPRGLLGRSFLIIVTPLIVLQAVTSYIFYDRHWNSVTRHLLETMAGEVAIVAHEYEREPSAAERVWLTERLWRDLDLRLTYNANGKLPSDSELSGNSDLEEDLAQAIATRLNRPFRVDAESREDRVRVWVQLSDGGVLRVTAPSKRLFSSTTYIFILWMVGTALVLLVVAMAFMRNQVRPLRRLANAMDRFGKGRDVADLKPQGSAEVRQAATAFQFMRARIGRQIRQRTDMLSGVSHDLRTILTRMRLQIALLGGAPGAAELAGDVREMETMLEGYLAFVRGEGEEALVATDLRALLGSVIEGAQRAGATVALSVEGDIVLPIRPIAFRRCIANLVDNAAAHGRHVAVGAAQHGDTVDIWVDDDGPGIAPERREDVFRPFYRLDDARNLDRGGVGLGLTVARSAARGHGGDLILDTSPTGGLRALVRVPL